jgi:hypothetical protein
MELAAHWHRCQSLPKKRVHTSLLYRQRDDPVKDGLANWRTGERATHIEETALDPARRRRSTKVSKEITRDSWNLVPITPLLKRGGFHALLLFIALTLLLKAYPILESKTIYGLSDSRLRISMRREDGVNRARTVPTMAVGAA